MKKLILAVAVGALAVTAPSAFGSANAQKAPCIALFTSNQGPAEVGSAASALAHEARPFGQMVIKESAQLREPCVEED